jgi:hypothetical protein
MVGCLRCFCPVYAAVLAASLMPQIVYSTAASRPPRRAASRRTAGAQRNKEPTSRRLDVMVGNSDEYAETVVSLQAPKRSLGIGERDHAKITSILSTAKEVISTAKALIDDERTLKEGTEMMEHANSMFREVKDHIAKRALASEAQGMVRGKNSERDIQKAEEDEERALDVARSVFETVSHFAPSGLQRFLFSMLISLCFVYCISRLLHSQSVSKCSYKNAS